MLNTVLERNPFEAPRSLVKNRKEQMVADARTHFLSQGIALEQESDDLQKLDAEFEPLAESEVKKHILLEAIAAKEDIKVSDSDVDEEIKNIADRHDQNVEKVRADLQKQEEGLDRFKQNLVIARTLDFLLSPDTIEEEKKT